MRPGAVLTRPVARPVNAALKLYGPAVTLCHNMQAHGGRASQWKKHMKGKFLEFTVQNECTMMYILKDVGAVCNLISSDFQIFENLFGVSVLAAGAVLTTLSRV